MLDLEKVKAQIEKKKGNLSAIGRTFKVSRQAVQKFVKNNTELQELVNDAREAMVDDAEDSLGKAVKKGEAWAVCFALKTQGKGRGYVERIEQTGIDGKPIQTETTIRVIKPKATSKEEKDDAANV